MMQMTITGNKEIEKNLLALERKMGRTIVRKAVNNSIKPILRSAKQFARSMVGGNMGKLISQSLISKGPKRQRRGQYLRMVRIRSVSEDTKLKKSKGVGGFVHETKSGTRYYIPAAIEFGHGNVAAIPFLRQAYRTNAKRSTNQLEKEIWAGITANISVSGVR